LDEIYAWLQSLTVSYPNDVTLINIGESYEKRQILGVRVNIGGGSNKKSIIFEGTHHAREWISSATITWMLNELLKSKNYEVRQIAKNYNFYIVPVTNPDGYVYTWTHNRFWRKNRRPISDFCKGVDLNRNWDNNFGKFGVSKNPCRSNYAGFAAFSEPETRQLARFIKKIPNLAGYFSFHAFAQALMIPYGHTKKLLDNYNELFDIGLKGIEALQSKFGTKYRIGSIGNVMCKLKIARIKSQ
jgi:Zinc carboxypeptidase